MSSCDRSDEVLAYLTGTMEPAERDDFEQHLAGCPSCRSELELERAVSSLLADGVKAPADLRLQVRRRLLLKSKSAFPWRALGAIAGMLAAVAVLLTSLLHLLPPNVDRQLEAMLRVLERNFLSVGSTGIVGFWLLLGVCLAGLATLVASAIPED